MRMSLALRFFLAYTAFIVYLCLFPWALRESAPGPLFIWNWPTGRTVIVDIFLNVGLYVPLGISCAMAFPGRFRALVVIALSFAISGSVEYVQTLVVGRVSSLFDLVANVSGAIAGLAATPILLKFGSHEGDRLRAAKLDYSSTILFCLFVFGHLFPFIPRYRLPHLLDAVNSITRLPTLASVTFTLVTFGCAALLVRRVFRPSLPWQLSMAAFVLFLMTRPLFVSRHFTGVDYLVAALGVIIGSTMHQGVAVRLLAVAFPFVLILREFYPFELSSTPQTFAWIPFSAFFSLEPTHVIQIFAEKLFLYGATIYVLAERGVSLRWATGLLMVFLAAGEAVQRFLPGRTPETSDIFLAAGIGLLLAICKHTERPAMGPHAGLRDN